MLLQHGKSPVTLDEAWLAALLQFTGALSEQQLLAVLRVHGVIVIGMSRAYTREVVGRAESVRRTCLPVAFSWRLVMF